MVYIVYKTTNLVNSKIYVGIHKQETSTFDGYYGSGILLHKAIKKYGIQNFVRETLFTYETLKEAKNKEKEIVTEEFCNRKDTYNISVGGTGGYTTAGYSAEQKKLIMEKAQKTKKINGSNVYEGDKLLRAIERMKKARIQPDNKNRKHTGQALLNMQEASKNKKGKYYWATNGEDTKLFHKDEEIPEGWVWGRGNDVPKFSSHKKESKEKIANHPKIKGVLCYTNGTQNIKIPKNEQPPAGFYRGMVQNKPKFRWVTNGEKNVNLPFNDPLPEGWRYGRTVSKRGKNGKQSKSSV